MKKTLAILTLSALAIVARAQYQLIDLTTRTTNATFTSGSQLTVPGVFTNKSYTTTNPAAVTIGDPLPTAFGKVNSTFVYISNQLFQALMLPNQINTNWQTYSVGLSNYMTTLAANLNVSNAWIISHVATNHGSGYYFTNGHFWGTFTGDGTQLIVSGTNVVPGTLNSNALDSDTLALFGSGGGGSSWPATNVEDAGFFITNQTLFSKAILPGGTTNYLTTNMAAFWDGSPSHSFVYTNRIVLPNLIPSFKDYRLDGVHFGTRPATQAPASPQLQISPDGTNWFHAQWYPYPVYLSIYDDQGGNCLTTGYADQVTNITVNGFIVPETVFRNFDLVGQNLSVDSYRSNPRSVVNVKTATGIAIDQTTNWSLFAAISGVNFDGQGQVISGRWNLTPQADTAGDYNTLGWQFEGTNILTLTPPTLANSNRVQIVSFKTTDGTNLTFKIFTQATNAPSLQYRTNLVADSWNYNTNVPPGGTLPTLDPRGNAWASTNWDCTGGAAFSQDYTNGLDVWHDLIAVTTNYARGYWTLTAIGPEDSHYCFYRCSSPTNGFAAAKGQITSQWQISMPATLYPSNTWSLTTITNGMKPGDIITVNSNGLKLVDVWLSNAVPILKPHW